MKAKLSCQTSLKNSKWKMWKRSFRARLPSKTESWRCASEAFLQDFPQNLKILDVKTKLSCKTSLKTWKWKMWKRSFRARLPSTSESWKCENEAFVRAFPQNQKVEDVKAKLSCEPSLKIWKWKMWKGSLQDFPQNLKAEDVQRKLSCETSLQTWKLKMWKWSFPARLPSKIIPARGPNSAGGVKRSCLTSSTRTRRGGSCLGDI